MSLQGSSYPSISVVIRSCNRPDALFELLDGVLAQKYDPFEVIVVEQSTTLTDLQQQRLAELESGQDKLTVLHFPPLGPAGARNAGWRQARNEIVLFIDDDDLPAGTDWIAQHAAHYADPDIVGVSGRELKSADDPGGYRNRARARRRCLSYNFLGYPLVYCRLNDRVDPVRWLHGGNSSVRRSFIESACGWDETLQDHEEHSFAFKLQRVLKGRQRLIFDPGPTIIRRKDVPGGLDRRNLGTFDIFERQFRYYHHVIARHRPARLVLLYPVYLLWMMGTTVRWIWKDSHRYRGSLHKLGASLLVIVAHPVWFVACWVSLLRALFD